MNIIFMGTPDFASAALVSIAEKYGEKGKITVVTTPDKQRGRAMKVTFSDVKKTALERGLEVYQPENLKRENFYEILEKINPDIIVVAAYGKLLPEYVLEYPKYGCINIHASLLPEYRGAAPINRCIIDGKTESGVTIMQMEKGLDTGDILMMQSTPISRDEDVGQLYERLREMGSQMIITAIDKIINGEITPVKQDSSKATYAEKITTETQTLDFSKSPETVRNLIRGLSPYPAAVTRHDKSGKIVKIYSARVGEESFPDAEYGEIVELKKTVKIKCGEGSLLIDELALEGSRRMSAVDFINGRRAEKGDRFI